MKIEDRVNGNTLKISDLDNDGYIQFCMTSGSSGSAHYIYAGEQTIRHIIEHLQEQIEDK